MRMTREIIAGEAVLTLAMMLALPRLAVAQNADVPRAWMSVSSDSHPLRAALASPNVDLEPAQDPAPPQTRRRDPIWNGLLIGAGVGAVLGLIPDHYDDCEECHDTLYGSIAMGAGVGLLIDLLRDGQSSTPQKREGLRLNVAAAPKAVRISGKFIWR
jgi:hypothetical protein